MRPPSLVTRSAVCDGTPARTWRHRGATRAAAGTSTSPCPRRCGRCTNWTPGRPARASAAHRSGWTRG
eukprot:2373790-Prymnesium_polylepis.1